MKRTPTTACTVLACALAFGIAAGASGRGAIPVLVLAGEREPGAHGAIHGRVVDAAGHPVRAARIHAYQTDAGGAYTRERPMDEPHARLAGWIACDDSGRFELRTIRPGGYPRMVHLRDRDRHIPAHVHLDLEVGGRPGHHWQAVFADDLLLSDPYWQEWVRSLGQPVLSPRRDGGGWRADVVLVAR